MSDFNKIYFPSLEIYHFKCRRKSQRLSCFIRKLLPCDIESNIFCEIRQNRNFKFRNSVLFVLTTHLISFATTKILSDTLPSVDFLLNHLHQSFLFWNATYFRFSSLNFYYSILQSVVLKELVWSSESRYPWYPPTPFVMFDIVTRCVSQVILLDVFTFPRSWLPYLRFWEGWGIVLTDISDGMLAVNPSL